MDILDNANVLQQRDPHEVADLLAKKWEDVSAISSLKPEVSSADNLAKQLAREMTGKAIVISGSEQFNSVALSWKWSINEVAHTLAWVGAPIEQSASESEGWLSHPIEKLYGVVDIRSDLDTAETNELFEQTARRLSGRRPAPICVVLVGETVDDQTRYGCALGEYVAYYLAVLYNVVSKQYPDTEEAYRSYE